jgi:hypothetical protein
MTQGGSVYIRKDDLSTAREVTRSSLSPHVILNISVRSTDMTYDEKGHAKEAAMRIPNRGTSESLQHTIPIGTADSPLSDGSSSRPDASAPNDAVQLSSLGGVLNSLQTSAKHSTAKINSVSRLIQRNKYQVDAIAISRKLIAASLQ